MSWTFDAVDGVYKNHALSTNLRHTAVADSHFFRFLSPEPGYGKGRGDTITITRTGQLPLATRVNESDPLPSGAVPKSVVSQTVTEWGYVVPVTELEQNLTHYNLRNDVQRALKEQMRLTLDKMTADELKTTPVRARTTTATAISITTNGIFSGAAQVELNISHLREIRDFLRGTQKTEGFQGGQYVGILSTNAARGIKNELTQVTTTASQVHYGAAVNADRIAGSLSPLMNGQLQDIEGFSLFETNNADALDDTAGSSAFGEAIFFGMDPAFLAMVSSPELRAGVKTNLGRFQDLGWVGTLDVGLTWPEAADARVVFVGST